jgi:hypothetical protein
MVTKVSIDIEIYQKVSNFFNLDQELVASLGPFVVAKVVGSQYQYDTDLADTNLGISNPLQSVVDGHLRI